MSLRLTAEIDGLQQFQRVMRNINDAARRELQEAVDESGEAVRDSAVRAILHGEKTGRVYTHYLEKINGRLVPVRKRSTPHQASAPGEAPASDSGYLVANIVVDGQVAPLEVAVVSLAPYSEELEYGRMSGRYPMEPRPFMRPALMENEDSTVARIIAALRRVARGQR